MKAPTTLVALACGLAAALTVWQCSQTALTPAERDHLADHTSKLAKCQSVGREAGTYEAYDGCKKEAGIP